MRVALGSLTLTDILPSAPLSAPGLSQLGKESDKVSPSVLSGRQGATGKVVDWAADGVVFVDGRRQHCLIGVRLIFSRRMEHEDPPIGRRRPDGVVRWV